MVSITWLVQVNFAVSFAVEWSEWDQGNHAHIYISVGFLKKGVSQIYSYNFAMSVCWRVDESAWKTSISRATTSVHQGHWPWRNFLNFAWILAHLYFPPLLCIKRVTLSFWHSCRSATAIIESGSQHRLSQIEINIPDGKNTLVEIPLLDKWKWPVSLKK